MPSLYRCENNRHHEKLNDYEKIKGGKKLPPKKINNSEKFKVSKKSNLSNYKNNAVKSLNEVEYFLRNFNEFSKYVKLYKILK